MFEEVMRADTHRQGPVMDSGIKAIAGVANIGTDPRVDRPDLHPRCPRGGHHARDDDGLARGRGRLHDALGLHHLMGTGHHYGPAPWVDDLERADWNPVYFHRASRSGIGFDRSPRGSNAVAQYAPGLAQPWSDPATTPAMTLEQYKHLQFSYAPGRG